MIPESNIETNLKKNSVTLNYNVFSNIKNKKRDRSLIFKSNYIQNYKKKNLKMREKKL